MDTNQIQDLAVQMAKQGASSNALALAIAIFTSCGGLLTAIALWIKAKAAHIASEDAKQIAFKTSDDAKQAAYKTAEVIQRIEVSVNSERTAMIGKLSALTTEVEQLKADKLAMSQQMKILSEEIAHLKSLAPTAKNSISKD